MHAEELDDSLDEGRSPFRERIGFKRLEEQVEVHGLFRRGRQPWVKERLVKRSEEPIGELV